MENQIVKKLREKTNEALVRIREERAKRQQKEREQFEYSIKERMHQHFIKFVTEKKLLEIAGKGLSEYPLLLITDNLYERPVKNKKTGYQYNIGKQGEYLFQEIIDNGFTPTIIKVDEYHLTENRNKFEIVEKPGFYLGIKW